jgi:hypothetical protein
MDPREKGVKTNIALNPKRKKKEQKMDAKRPKTQETNAPPKPYPPQRHERGWEKQRPPRAKGAKSSGKRGRVARKTREEESANKKPVRSPEQPEEGANKKPVRSPEQPEEEERETRKRWKPSNNRKRKREKQETREKEGGRVVLQIQRNAIPKLSQRKQPRGA